MNHIRRYAVRTAAISNYYNSIYKSLDSKILTGNSAAMLNFCSQAHSCFIVCYCWQTVIYSSNFQYTAKQKGNFQPDRVTSVATSMPNNADQLHCLITIGSKQLS